MSKSRQLLSKNINFIKHMQIHAFLHMILYISMRTLPLAWFNNCACDFDREESEGNLKGILGYTDEHVVSTDFVGDSRLASKSHMRLINLLF